MSFTTIGGSLVHLSREWNPDNVDRQIRAEYGKKIVDLNVSAYSHIWTSGQKIQTINGVVQFAMTRGICLFLVHSASRVLAKGVIVLYVKKNWFNQFPPSF